jgi:hypothetical protein
MCIVPFFMLYRQEFFVRDTTYLQYVVYGYLFVHGLTGKGMERVGGYA